MQQVSKIIFCHETLHVLGIYCAHHQELSAVHVAIGMFHADYVADSPRQRPHNLHETYQFARVQLITRDDGHSGCLKHVEFRDKITFGYLMHLLGYLYEDYHDSRSLEHKDYTVSHP
jgi:hypothetical protein